MPQKTLPRKAPAAAEVPSRTETESELDLLIKASVSDVKTSKVVDVKVEE